MTIGYNINAYASGVYATATPISTTATPKNTNGSGSSFLVCCGGYISGLTFVVTDNKGNTGYTLIGTQQNDTPDGVSGALYLMQNGAGGSGHIWSVNAANGVDGFFYVLEIVNGLLSGILDQFYGNTGTLGNPTPGPVTPTQNNELVTSFFLNNSGNAVVTTPANGFTSLNNDSSTALLVKQVTGGSGIVQDPSPSFTPGGGATMILTASFIPQTVAPASSYYMSSAVEF